MEQGKINCPNCGYEFGGALGSNLIRAKLNPWKGEVKDKVNQ